MTTEPPRIMPDRALLASKPLIRSTRLPAEFIMGLTLDAWGETDTLANYPGTTHEGILARLAYARERPWQPPSRSSRPRFAAP